MQLFKKSKMSHGGLSEKVSVLFEWPLSTPIYGKGSKSKICVTSFIDDPKS